MPALTTLTDDRPDTPARAVAVLRLAGARRPGMSSLLDVSGQPDLLPPLARGVEHLEVVTPTHEAGVAAHRALPTVAIHQSDLTSLRLPGRFDVVTALGTGLAALPLSRFTAAVGRLAAHLEPGGLLILEPFWLPGHATLRSIDAEVTRDDERGTVSSVRHVSPRDGACVVARHVLIADQHGVRHEHEERVLHAFGRLELLGALAAAGCGADLLPTALAGRPVVVGTRR